MKQKTHKSAQKRFKITKKGKLFHRSQGIRHLKSKKSSRKIRALKQLNIVTARMEKKIKRLLAKK